MKTEDSKFVDYVGKLIDRLEDERCSDTIRKSRRKVDNTTCFYFVLEKQRILGSDVGLKPASLQRFGNMFVTYTLTKKYSKKLRKPATKVKPPWNRQRQHSLK